jgi:hypothetical protein
MHRILVLALACLPTWAGVITITSGYYHDSVPYGTTFPVGVNSDFSMSGLNFSMSGASSFADPGDDNSTFGIPGTMFTPSARTFIAFGSVAIGGVDQGTNHILDVGPLVASSAITLQDGVLNYEVPFTMSGTIVIENNGGPIIGTFQLQGSGILYRSMYEYHNQDGSAYFGLNNSMFVFTPEPSTLLLAFTSLGMLLWKRGRPGFSQ